LDNNKLQNKWGIEILWLSGVEWSFKTKDVDLVYIESLEAPGKEIEIIHRLFGYF
jgi:hypothetical protein